MTELDWNRSADACALLDHLHPPRGHDSTPDQTRKLRLYLVALCRAAWAELPGPCRAAAEFAERLADADRAPHRVPHQAAATVRQVAERMMQAYEDPAEVAACRADLAAVGLFAPDPPAGAAVRHTADSWRSATAMAFLPLFDRVPPYRWVRPADHRADLVRCVFGNPLRPRDFDPGWRTPTAVGVATAAYRGRAWDRLPVLADALEDAGCDAPDLLAHLRSGGPHARGCWAVDLVLGVE